MGILAVGQSGIGREGILAVFLPPSSPSPHKIHVPSSHPEKEKLKGHNIRE